MDNEAFLTASNCEPMQMPTMDEIAALKERFDGLRNNAEARMKKTLEESGIPHAFIGDPWSALAMPRASIEELKKHSADSQTSSLLGLNIVPLEDFPEEYLKWLTDQAQNTPPQNNNLTLEMMTDE